MYLRERTGLWLPERTKSMFPSPAAGGIKALPTYLDAGAMSGENPLSGTLQVAYPATVVNSNLLIAALWQQDSGAANSITTPSGWTQIDEKKLVSGLAFGKAIYKIADGTETGNLDVTMSGGNVRAGGRIFRFNGGRAIGAGGRVESEVNNTTVPVYTTGITTTQRNSIVVQLIIGQTGTTMATITGMSGGTYSQPQAYAITSSVGCGIQTAPMSLVGTISGGSAAFGANTAAKIGFAFIILP